MYPLHVRQILRDGEWVDVEQASTPREVERMIGYATRANGSEHRLPQRVMRVDYTGDWQRVLVARYEPAAV